jgi:hypothetical protein
LLGIVFCNNGLLHAEQYQHPEDIVKVTARGEGGKESMKKLNEAREEAILKKGGIVTHTAPTSTSNAVSTAKIFAESKEGNPTLFVVMSPDAGINISPLSCMSGEDEVLLAPSSFKLVLQPQEGKITQFTAVPIRSIDQLKPFSYMHETADLRTSLICIKDTLTELFEGYKKEFKKSKHREEVSNLIVLIENILKKVGEEGDIRDYTESIQQELDKINDAIRDVKADLKDSDSKTSKKILKYICDVENKIISLAMNTSLAVSKNNFCLAIIDINNVLPFLLERYKDAPAYDKKLQDPVDKLIKQINKTLYELNNDSDIKSIYDLQATFVQVLYALEPKQEVPEIKTILDYLTSENDKINLLIPNIIREKRIANQSRASSTASISSSLNPSSVSSSSSSSSSYSSSSSRSSLTDTPSPPSKAPSSAKVPMSTSSFLAPPEKSSKKEKSTQGNNDPTSQSKTSTYKKT